MSQSKCVNRVRISFARNFACAPLGIPCPTLLVTQEPQRRASGLDARNYRTLLGRIKAAWIRQVYSVRYEADVVVTSAHGLLRQRSEVHGFN